ncbi:MAG: M60 family metallopeptidase, partial [Armatimonadetes bacterium]|nr:M60 family metallopeptidase [Armatimonadota bacterium]
QPRNDMEKHDQFLIHYSRVVGKNLGPFFQAWAVPTSQAARDSVKELPKWLPKDFPKSPNL